MTHESRRNILKNAFLASGTILLAQKQVLANACELTPEQTEGPFYPINQQLDKDRDLTFIQQGTKKAKGEVIILEGIVRDQDCRPVQKALVEIWQACASGKYNHPADPNPAPLDPHFQYWGRALTDENGHYHFKTIRPGQYPATPTWMRPSHIHLKVHRRGFEELTTQVYFKDDPFNKTDHILQSLSSEERKKVIVEFKADQNMNKPKQGQFDISIHAI